jgi:hypothetical protein
MLPQSRLLIRITLLLIWDIPLSLLGVASRYAEQKLLTADPTFSSVYFVCSSEIKTRNDDGTGLLRRPLCG